MKKTDKDLILEYLKNDFNTYEEESDKYIDAMLDISSTTSSLGGELTGLLASLNDMQRSRFLSLQKELKNGLGPTEKPLSSFSKANASSDFLLYCPKDSQTQEINFFLNRLNLLTSSSFSDVQKAKEIRLLKTDMKKFETKGIKLKNFISTKNEKKVWNMLIFSDPDKMDKYEIEDILLKMKLAVSKHDKKLKEVKDYFNSFEKIEKDFVKITSKFIDKKEYGKILDKHKRNLYSLKKPYTKEIVQEVSKIKEYLENKLEKFPEYLNDEQKVIMSDFLPMLNEYYEDQCIAFVQEKRYLPMARDLEEFHNSVEKMKVLEFLETSDRLGFTMQHLYLLHWVGEELMKKFHKKDLTLGRNITKRKDFHKKKNISSFNNYENFLKGVIFRNDVAHNGIIWQPQSFEEAINRYKEGILLLGVDFQQKLSREPMPKRKEIKLSIKDEFANKYFDLMYDIVWDTLSSYTTHFKKVESMEEFESKTIKPATSALFYLYKTFEDKALVDSDMYKIEDIKKILKRENHA